MVRNHIVQWLKVIVRNVAGWVLIATGLFLSIPGVPSPGTPVVLVGLALADWPGKQRFFRWLRSFHWFDTCDNWIHRKVGFRLPEHCHLRKHGSSKEQPAEATVPSIPVPSSDQAMPPAVKEPSHS